MAYLLDTNVFIEATRSYYAFDICPGFWDWIEGGHRDGSIKSIDKVKSELIDYGDELAAWARRHGDDFFLVQDAPAAAAMRTVSSWVQAAPHRDAGKREFLAGADPFLIAYASAHGHTVVTQELLVPNELRRVKIPVVCEALTIPWARTFEVLRSTAARFVLRGP